MNASDLRRLGETIRHLEPSQVARRLQLRSQRAVATARPDVLERRWTPALPIDQRGWPTDFVALDTACPPERCTAERIRAGWFDLLGEQHRIVDGWRPTERSQLFRYHLHYFEWAHRLAADADRASSIEMFQQLWRSWEGDARYGRWDEWSPYVVSLRAWALAAVWPTLIGDTPIADDVAASLLRHLGFIRNNLERDVGGNHLIKNLKAMVGLGVFFRDEASVADGLDLLRLQVDRQVLADGGHFERSPSYHLQVLGDLDDLRRLLDADGRGAPSWLTDAVAAMKRWADAMTTPDGALPLFGDAVQVDRARLDALGVGAGGGSHVLDASGFVVVRSADGATLICDVGEPCPPELPAHAQAASLTFLLWHGAAEIVVDTGVSTYVGDRRDHERSTAAHSTVEIDDRNSTDVYGSFRAGHRANVTLLDVELDGPTATIVAEHDGYRRLTGAPTHRRTWRLGADRLSIADHVGGVDRHRLVSRVHLDPPQAELVRFVGGNEATGTVWGSRATAMGQRVPMLTKRWCGVATLPADLPAIEIDLAQGRRPPSSSA